MSQVKVFKYLWVLLTNEGKMEYETDRPIGVPAIMQVLHQTIMVKRELCMTNVRFTDHLWSQALGFK